MHRAIARTLALLATVFLGPVALASPAHADSLYCRTYPLFYTVLEAEALPNAICVTHVPGRGQRAYITFDPPTNYQLAGQFFVTLTRNGTQVAKSTTYVNPVVKPNFATSWPTPYVEKAGGTFCVKVWERRTPTINDLLESYCHTLP